MLILKPMCLGLSYRPMEYRKRFGLCVSGYLHLPFAQAAGGTVWGEQSMWNFLAQEMALPQIDEGIAKLTSEFLVHGHAYPDPAYPGRNAVAVRARLGSCEKTVLAFGDRYWDGEHISAPAPFERIALDWSQAYGGPDFADNPVGKGRTAVEGVKWLPNLELPDSRVVQRRAPVRPAAFAALDAMHPQRAALRGTYDEVWFKQHSPGFAPDLNWKHFNQAPEDQWLDTPLQGDETFALHNLHPTRPLIEGRLPGLRVRCFVRRRAADPAGSPGKLREVAMRPTTVWFFPHAERLVLVFHGLAPCDEDDGADLDLLLGAIERLDPTRRRDDAHYLRAIELRTASPHADLYALRQSDLIPKHLDTRDPAFDDIGGAMKPAGLKEEAVLRRAQMDVQMARKAATARGLDPDALGLKVPERPRNPTLDELPEILIPLRRQAEDQQWQALEKMLDHHLALQDGIRKGRIDPVTAVHRGPPQLTAAASLAAMEQAHARTGAPLDREQARTRLVLADELRKLTYLQSAHEQAPALPQQGAAAARTRDDVLWMLSRNFRNWKGLDFTGADLSNLDLRGVDLREAWLESADLQNSNLSRARLAGAVMAHANLRGLVAVLTDFSGANLGGSRIENALLERADLRGATLSNASLVRSELRRVQGAGLQLHQTRFQQVDWYGAQLAGVLFYQLDLHTCGFAGADLSAALLVECDLRGVDFGRARLAGASINAGQAQGAVFAQADLSGAQFSGATELSGADFTAADASRANFGDSVMRQVRGARACFNDAVLAGVDLTQADLRRAGLQRSLLRKAVLRGVRLDDANLMDALMQRADLRSARLPGAQLFAADLSRVRLDADSDFDRAVLDQARTHPRLTPEQQAQMP